MVPSLLVNFGWEEDRIWVVILVEAPSQDRTRDGEGGGSQIDSEYASGSSDWGAGSAYSSYLFSSDFP